MLPETVYRISYVGTSTFDYRIDRDGERVYTAGGPSGSAVFETPDGEEAFRVETWGLSDERYGYAVRDAEGEAFGWIADDVPFLGRRLAIKSMEDVTLGTLGDDGLVGKALYELSTQLPFDTPARLAFKTAEGHTFGRVTRELSASEYTLGLEDVGLDERLALAAVVVLANRDQWDREQAYRNLREA